MIEISYIHSVKLEGVIMKIKLLIVISFILSSVTFAQNNITEEKSSVTINVDGKKYTIKRIQGKDVYLTNEFSLTSRPSPPFFIQPFKVTKDVDTYGELEVIEFLEKGKGIFIDARLNSWYKKSYIAGAVNIPLQAIMGFMNDIKKHNKAVVLYCRSGARATTALNLLTKSGIEAYNAGGIGDLQRMMD